MQSVKLRQQSDVLHRIAKASDAIRRKHKMLKLGRDTSEKTMSEVFKPVVIPLQQLVDQSTKREVIKEEIRRPVVKEEFSKTNVQEFHFPSPENEQESDDLYSTADEDSIHADNDGDTTVTDRDTSSKRESFEEVSTANNDLFQPYLQMFDTSAAKQLDTSYGIRRLKGNILKIGNSVVTLDGNVIRIENMSIQATSGLLELLFKKLPNINIVSEDDLKQYGLIVTTTNAHRKFYHGNTPIRKENNYKFKNIISKILSSTKGKTGKALPRYKIVRGLKNHMDYVYWDDPNELIDRLRLLYASQAAGNANHSNEIISIIEELREAGIIY